MLLPVVKDDSPPNDVMPFNDGRVSEPLREQAVADGVPQKQHAASST
jgi:hypothetical protein